MANQNLSTRTNAGASVVVVPGTSDGLVSKNGVPGNTTGVAIATGYVGEVVTFTPRTVTAVVTSWTAGGNSPLTTLQPGVWLVLPDVSVASSASGDGGYAYLISTNNNADATGNLSGQGNIQPMGSTALPAGGNRPVTLVVTSATAIYGKVYQPAGTGRVITWGGFAVRIA